MELLIFRHSEFERLYNCSILADANISQLVSPEKKAHPIYGFSLIILASIYQLLYIPCLYSLHKLSVENSCYKFLFFIGIIDIMAIWMCGFLTGIFGILGAEFCTYPTLNYVAGAYGLALWIAESGAEWLLAVNRSLEMIAPKISRKLFDEGNRCLLWILAISIYALCIFLFSPPICYSAVHFTWLFNPFGDYLPQNDAQFRNFAHAIHNIFLSFAFPATYFIFLTTFYIKVRFYTQISSHNGNTNLQKLIFLQVFLLGVMNTFGCTFYLYMQYVEVTDTLMVVATFNWLNIHGFPPIIYLVINKSIRQDCLQMGQKICCLNKILPHPAHSSAGQIGLGAAAPASSSTFKGGIPIELRPRSKNGVFGKRQTTQQNEGAEKKRKRGGMPEVNS